MIKAPDFDIRKNNFNAARVILAIVVVFQHLSLLTQFQEFKIFQEITYWIQPVESFFVISGFLIASSYLRSKSLSEYFEKRARRILPAYFVVVIVCAFLGIFVAKGSLLEYLSIDLLKYLAANLIFLNFLAPSLPAVFVDNPYTSAVNGSLWTIKIELMFYAILPILFYLIRRYSKITVLFSTYIISLTYYLALQHYSIILNRPILAEIARQLPGYLSYFSSAILVCLYYDFFLKKRNFLMFLALPLYIFAKLTGFFFLIPICQAAIIMYFCLFFNYLGNWNKYGDFSYGIYIWHFPIIQTLLNFKLYNERPFLFLFLLILFTFALSFISWHGIEKLALKRLIHKKASI